MPKIYGFERDNHPEAAMLEFGETDLGPSVQFETDGVSYPVPSDLLALTAYLETIQNK